MIFYPADFLAASATIPPAEEWIIAKLQMPSGDVWLTDRPSSPGLINALPVGVTPLDYVENWGELQDGGTVEGFLNPGGLECPQTRITVIRADQNKTDIDAIIQQGIHNRYITLYRWFEGMTSPPVIIDTLFAQDRIELKESSMLWGFDAVGCLCSENPYLTERTNGYDTYPYLVGKAQGLRLSLLEEQSSKWTILLGDQTGNEISEDYTGLIRVDDATNLFGGVHLINGEKVMLTTASAGYMTLTARGQGGTEPQEHSAGSRIFPDSAVFKYAVCAGSIGSFEFLRTSNEIDVYDEDGDGNTIEYRDLYSGENEIFHPELNPAQIWFSDRMPWLKKDQDYTISDKLFYGRGTSWSSLGDIKNPNGINKENGNARISISFRRFSEPSLDYWYKDTTIPLPSLPGEGTGATTYAASENLSDGSDYFSISQSFGEYITNMTSTAYREFRINSACPGGEEAWTMIEPELPDIDKFVFTDGGNYWAIIFQRLVTYYMDVKIDIYEVSKNGAEFPLFSVTKMGSMQGERDWYPGGYSLSQQFIDYNAYTTNRRLKFKITCLNNNAAGAYAFVRIGGKSQYSEDFHYGMAAFWRYNDSAPTASLSSKFLRNFTSKGVFDSASARIKGVLRNTENKADGTLKIFDGATEKYSTSLTEGQEIDTTINLSASTWSQLSASEIKIEVSLDYALIINQETATVSGIPRTDGAAGIDFDGGVEWLISYTANNLDGVQINFTDSLYVDAVSSHGADWTPARALQYLAEDKTTWFTDFLDVPDLDDRHAEYATVDHFLNGTLDGSLRLQSAFREIFRQGFCRPQQSSGKLRIKNHLTDLSEVVSLTVDNDSLFQKSKNFSMTDTKELLQKMTVNYNRNFSTGKYDGQYEKDTGEHVENYDVIYLDLVSSETATVSATDWLFDLKSQQLQIFGFDGNFRLLMIQKSDMINLPDFLSGDVGFDMVAISVKTIFGQGKNNKIPKLLMNFIKR